MLPSLPGASLLFHRRTEQIDLLLFGASRVRETTVLQSERIACPLHDIGHVRQRSLFVNGGNILSCHSAVCYIGYISLCNFPCQLIDQTSATCVQGLVVSSHLRE